MAELLERYSELEVTEKFAGTPSFQPPEVAKGTRTFSATKVGAKCLPCRLSRRASADWWQWTVGYAIIP